MYAELHARSAFSFLEGATLPEDLVAEAARLEMPAVAMLDRDNLSGAVRFHKAAVKAGLRALIGAEVTAVEGFRYPLIVETRQGYQNLCRLLSKIKLNSQPGATRADIEQHAAGLICLTRGVQRPLDELVGIFGRANVYVELQRHLHRDEEALNRADVEAARRAKLPLLATNGIHHATPAERELADTLTAIRHRTTIQRAGKLLARNAERHLKPAAQMQRLFADRPEAISNSLELAQRVTYSLANLGYEFPRYPVGPGETMNSFLRQRVDEGAHSRFRPYHERARRQMERELALIEKLDLAGYFLIVWDIVQFCRRQGIMVQGRGSAANSAVCYALGITAVDPIAMDLLFERFLSENRDEWPDIDVDLPSGDDREQVIQYVYRRYGQLGAAMTANVITYRGRSAVRDVGKALGFPEEVLGRLSKLSSRGGWEHAQETPPEEQAGKLEQQLRAAGLDRQHPLVGKLVALSGQIQDLPRHLGQHSGGMVICQGQLDAIVPLQPATMPGRVIVQWDKEDCADMGIIKVDLLGLGMMAVLRDSVNLIRTHYREEVDLAQIPKTDPQVYQALQQADTVGMFQVESRAQISFLPQMKPQHFYDIVVQVAIIRPGPIVGKMLHPYLRRRQGMEPATSLHPSLDEVLKRTLGVPLFQEQLLRMAMIAADFTGGEAEELRRAMGFKRSQQRMAEIDVRLREGMTRKGIDQAAQDAIVLSITSFALYGFPESHAISFALIAYASAYLKCHYLAAFTAAILNNQPMGFYNSFTLVKDAQRHGLHFQPVDVTQSDWLCTLEQHAGVWHVRLGFNYVKGFRHLTASNITHARAQRPFSSIDDLTRRTAISREELKSLAELGALNNIGAQIPGTTQHRRGALWQSELALRPAGELFEQLDANPQPSPLAPMTLEERLSSDFRRSGLTIGAHPMRLHRETLAHLNVVPAAQVRYLPDRKPIRVAGAVICRQQPSTAKGFVFLSLEDETGIVNVIFQPDMYARHKLTVLGHPALIIDGILQNQRGVASVKANDVRAMEAVPVAAGRSHDFC